ncbi:hypothetical protein [Undibacterium sp. TS12]|uniref:hypothetical protein n=1 Tax=Undibacterium sp. TS12 TaxID=2908202 RepID=UPI001F4D203A|nr:hypothetical protein [Undibacterium sp. TS12]MCH8622461.1 hypothetical protein [Undibacterium sp. TS12]
MNTRPACLVSYFAAWNSHSIGEIQQNVSDAFGTNTRYFDPHRVAIGVEEFSACLAEFRAQRPDAEIVWTSGVDSHHNLHRYSWEVCIANRAIVAGYDVVEVDEAGKIVTVFSFFGSLPDIG